MAEPKTLKDLIRHHKQVDEDRPHMDLEPIKALFEDEDLPEIDETQVGKIRLLKALRRKFGADFRSIPNVKAALEHYNKESEFQHVYKKIIGGRHGK